MDSNSGSDNKGSRASASSKPSGSGGVRYDRVTDADGAGVRQNTEEAKAKQTPASVTIKKSDTLSEIAKANDMSVAQIKAINDIKNVNETKSGQKIKLKTKEIRIREPQNDQFVTSEKYRLSFGTGGLYVTASAQLVQLFSDLGYWSEVIEDAVEKNLLQFKSTHSTRRAVREICTRLKSLSIHELDLFAKADPFDQSILCWLASCRTYKFIGDFATQVILENFACYKLKLGYADFDFFYGEQSQFHPELEALTHTTRKKLRQILFRMQREAGILSDDNRIIAGIASQSLKDINAEGERDLPLFVPGASL